MFALLLDTRAGQALAPGHQQFVSLGQLPLKQSIKRIGKMNFKRVASCTPLTHAF
jgi:hypothetical protein